MIYYFYYSSFYKFILINTEYSHIEDKTIFYIDTWFSVIQKVLLDSFIFFRHIFTLLFSFADNFSTLFCNLFLYRLAIFIFSYLYTFLMHSLILLFIALSVSFSLPVLMVHNFQWKVCCQNLLSSSVNGCSWEPACPPSSNLSQWGGRQNRWLAQDGMIQCSKSWWNIFEIGEGERSLTFDRAM